VAAAAIEISVPPANEGEAGVRGVAIEPRLHRSSRNYISLYVNRRWVRNRALTFAVEEAYQGMLPVGRRPIAALDLSIPPEDVDVNVHPTKAEVRLRREREVFGLLQRAVRRAFSGSATVPAASPSLWSGGGSESARTALVLEAPPRQAPLPHVPPRHDDAAEAAPSPAPDRLPPLRAIGQIGNLYVVAEGPEGMYLVDQHAAHERVLYERFLAGVRVAAPDAQSLLEPLTLELSAPHRALLDEHVGAFSQLGFEVDHFGDAAYVLRAVPSSIAGSDLARHVVELLDRLGRDELADTDRDPSHRLAASLACHAAVRAGKAMSPDEQRELLRLLERAESPRTCPHGRPTMVHLAADAIAREFRRR
jgi:DNA mismatch repair protein MutL